MVYSYKSRHHAHATTTTVVASSPTALHKAADANDAAAVVALLRGAADPNARVECRNCDEGATALHLAAQKGHAEAALALLEGGARPDGRRVIGPDRPKNNETRLSFSDDSDSSSYVSDSDDVSDYHPGGGEGDLTPLHLACAGGHTAVVYALLSAGERTDRIASGRKARGLDIDIDTGAQHSSSSSSSSEDNNPPVADDDSGDGIGISAVASSFLGGEEGGRYGGGGHTPLHLASACGAAGAVRALVEFGASVHPRARDFDDTPLHLASAAGHLEVMKVLLEAGADVNAGDEIGNTPLHVARDVRTLELLLARGANPNLVAMSRYGSSSALGSYCTLVHRLETDEKGMERATAQVEALLRYGANVNIRASSSDDQRDDDELPPPPRQAATANAASPILSCAAKNGVPGIVSALLRAGLNPNERDKDGWAPIHDAAQGNHVDVLRLLLRAGAERDAPTTDRGQWKPLHIACRYTSVECVHLLLRWGASLGPTARPVARPVAGSDAFSLGRKSGRPIFGDYGGGAHKNIASVSDAPEEGDDDDDNDDDDDDDDDDDVEEGEENGYGKTPAEVIGLKNLAAAATDPAGDGIGGSGPSADPSLDEEEEQMVVLGGDDEQKAGRTEGVGERNAIRRALRREAAWRRRRSVVLLKVYLDRQQRQLQTTAAAVGAGTAAMPLPACVGGSANRDNVGGTTSFKRSKGKMRDAISVQLPRVASLDKPTAEAEGGAGGGIDDFLYLRTLLEGVVDLAGHEEALFQQIVTLL